MRDIETARRIVGVVFEAIDPYVGDALVEVVPFRRALDEAAAEVADLLDPDEEFDAVIDEPDPICPAFGGPHVYRFGECVGCGDG